MTALTLVAVTVEAKGPDGTPIANARVRFTLTRPDTDGQLVVPTIFEGTTDASGIGVVNAWPNRNSQYRVDITAGGLSQFSGVATVPPYDCRLDEILTLQAPTVDDAQAAVLKARDWAVKLDAPVEGDELSAKAHAQQAALDRQQADQDALQTLADRQQTGLDRVQADADRTQTSLDRAAADGDVQAGRGFMLTSVAQASLASIYALAAASVAQQDFSGVTAAALHRSPNAVVAMCIDDPRTWSDGGACLQKLDHLSWANETLQGAWLGAQAGETFARMSTLTLGAELLPNGTFDAGVSGWTPSTAGNTTSSGGRLKVTALVGGSGSDSTYTTVPILAGVIYRISVGYIQAFDASGNVDPSARARIGFGPIAGTITFLGASDGLGGRLVAPATAADPSVQYFTVSQNTTLSIVAETASNTTYAPQNYSALFDNISLKSVSGNYAASGSYYQDVVDGKFKRLWKNQIPQSEALTASGWSAPSAATVTDNVETVTYNGATVALSKLVPTTGNASHYVGPTAAIQAQGQIVVSCLAKAEGYSQVYFGTTSFSNYARVDITTGAVTVGGGTVTGGSTSLGGGLYLVWASWNQSVAANLFVGAANGAFAFSGDGVSGIRIGGVQVESGSTPSTYEKKTTDGSVTEVFRGNVRNYGRTTWVAEASRVVGYAIDQPGRPMWMVFATNGTTVSSSLMQWLSGSVAVQCIAARDGKLFIGGNSSIQGLLVDFAKDDVIPAAFGSQLSLLKRRISERQSSGQGYVVAPVGYSIASNTINSVAMTTMPDAPVDPVTGLHVPTIAVGTSGGLSIVHKDGTVVSSAYNGSVTAVAITPYMVSYRANTSAYAYALAPNSLGASFASVFAPANPPSFGGTNMTAQANGPRGRVFANYSGAAELQFMVMNEGAFGSGLFARIRDIYNTGWMVGSVMRCYLSDVAVGTISNPSTITDRTYKAKTATVFGTLTRAQVGIGSQLVAYGPFSAANYAQEGYSSDLDFLTGSWRVSAWANFSTAVVSTLVERSFSSGPSITLGTDASGRLTATAYDGTNTRTVTSAAAYNLGVWVKVTVEYSTSGTLTLRVNGIVVAQATGTPLLTMNNASAVLTIGNNYALTAPFPGSLALIRIGATVATEDQSQFAYAQERQMFRDGAQICLPDSGPVVDLDYDPAQDKLKVVSAANESSFVGMVRTASSAVPAGSFSRVAHKGGIKLLSRTGANPGADITIPPLNAIEQMNRRAEDARAQSRLEETFDYVGGFTATTTANSTALTAVAGVSLPPGATMLGALVSGAGIPAGTTVTAYSGTTVQLSAPCTANGSSVQVAFLDFILPTGFEGKSVNAARFVQYEGATKDWTRRFDGFRESERFLVPPGYSAQVQVKARRVAA